MIVIYEQYVNDRGLEDEKHIYGCDSVMQMISFFARVRHEQLKSRELYRALKSKKTINKKYKIYKID